MKEMKYLAPFDWTGDTFEDRIGEPEAFDAAVGRIAMNFSDLEHTVDRFVWQLVRLLPRRPATEPSRLSFRGKVDLLASTVSELKDVLRFNAGPAPSDEFFAEIKHNCLQAHALYREIAGAKWGYRRARGIVEILDREDPTSDLSSQPLGALDADKLLDIADFFSVLDMELEEFFLDSEVLTPEAA